MKGPTGFKMPKLPFPTGAAAKGALSYASQFAYHAMPKAPRPGRMERPRGGKGPKVGGGG